MTPTVVRTLYLVLAGLVSAQLVDMVGVLWLKVAPAALDLTGGYLFTVAAPATLIVNFLAALALWKLMEPAPVRNTAVYLGVHLTALALTWASAGNPAEQIALVCAASTVSGIAVFGTFRHFFWCGCEPPTLPPAR